LLFAQTEYGAVALFTSNTPGGAIARRLLPFAFAVPAFLGALRLWGEKLRVFNADLGVTIMVLLCIAAFGALIWWNALILNRADERRRQAEEGLQRAHDELEVRVRERTSDLCRANEALRAEISERRRAEQRIREQAEEKTKLEEQFLRAQRMESLGALASGIAHDLNNALVPILMGSQLLRDDPTNEKQRLACLEMILGSGQRCTQMVRQIVSFARGSRTETTSLQLRPLLTEMVKIVSDTFPKSIGVRCLVPKDLSEIQGDPTELHQVLMNLCVNARDAMPNGGELRFSAENVAPLSDLLRSRPEVRPGHYILLSVADTGTGIPSELVPRIFEPFFTTKAPDKGTGLGLSTVASIVKKHNGFVEVESEVGKGTKFKIFLPAIQATPAAPKPKTAALPVGQGELILVVDDEKMVVELARTTLENYGYRVITAPNGLEAITRFEAHKDEIRLLVTDTDMPFLDGIKSIEAILEIKPDMPVILASGGTRDTELRLRMNSSRLFVISKPYDVDQLLIGVARALHPERHL
jgi:two-component system cell cycle sensor histidine kinase/response regulator CckA